MEPRFCLAAVLAFTAACATTPAEPVLGSADLSLYAEHHSVILDEGAAPHALRMQASQPLEVRGLRFFFADGSTAEMPVAMRLHADGWSSAIDVPERKEIRRVELWYRSSAPPETYATVWVTMNR